MKWDERLVRFWTDLLDSLNTDGGHILLLSLAVAAGAVMGALEYV